MADDSRKTPAPGARRVAHIVHDDLGNARVEWQEIPDDRTGSFARPTLEIEGARTGKSGNPYERAQPTGGPDKRSSTTRTDLRKLSEWIKLKRELEARKGREEEDEKG